MPDGLRERKKRETREAIVRVAMKLFRKRGYDATTIADIAEAADIAPRTFFGYFSSKEEVVFHDFEEVLAAFAERVRDRPEGETAFDALREWILEQVAEGDAHSPWDRDRRKLILTTPALEAHHRANFARFGAVLADGVAADLDVPADALLPQLVSAAAIGALDVLRHSSTGTEALDEEQAVTVMDEALAFLQGGLRALRRQPQARSR